MFECGEPLSQLARRGVGRATLQLFGERRHATQAQAQGRTLERMGAGMQGLQRSGGDGIVEGGEHAAEVAEKACQQRRVLFLRQGAPHVVDGAEVETFRRVAGDLHGRGNDWRGSRPRRDATEPF